ncbi:MAG: 3-oxoacyl-[acyl-carrier protein] reductase [Gaiellales bacterium]|nr:3-oxoacyl-[acyl-carrier protein] reductase [Gaiellales bacterium]
MGLAVYGRYDDAVSSAIVTGAANGIGRATAERLLADGFAVAGLDIEPVEIPGVRGIHCDMADVESFEDIVESVERDLGPIDALANVAGIAVNEALADLTVAGYRRQLAVSLDGPIFLAKAVGVRMAARKRGRIVNVTSVHAHHSEATALAYGASKAGLEAATRVMAIELGPHGVLVNDVAPGFVRTRMSVVDGQNELDSEWFHDVYQKYGKLPLRRAAEPAEIAATISYLLSEANTYVSGTSVRVDGGLLATF